jgi:hypothetical protein
LKIVGLSRPGALPLPCGTVSRRSRAAASILCFDFSSIGIGHPAVQHAPLLRQP